MTKRFIKFIPSKEADYLQEYHPNAFLLLCLIAKRAVRTSNDLSGLEIGEAHIGDFKVAGIDSEKKYRVAKKVLENRKHIKVCETCRTRKKQQKIGATERATERATNKATERATLGTKVRILKSNVWDINEEDKGDRKGDQQGDRKATERATNKNVLRKYKKEKEYTSDSVESNLANFFLQLILKRKPNFKKPNLQTWAKHIGDMIRIDQRTEEQIRNVMLWVNQDNFEFANVLSTDKLRQRFDQLEEKSKKISPNSNIQSHKSLALEKTQGLVSQYFELKVKDQGVVLIPLKGQMSEEVLNYNNPDFPKQLENIIKNREFRREL